MFQVPGFKILSKYGCVNFGCSDDFVCRAVVERDISLKDQETLEEKGWYFISDKELIFLYE